MKAPEHWRPWTKKIPAWMLLPLLVVLTPAILLLSTWDGGIKEGASYVAELWNDFMATNRRIEKESP